MWILTLALIENVTVKKTFAGTDQFYIFWLITIFLDPTLSKIVRARFLQCFF